MHGHALAAQPTRLAAFPARQAPHVGSAGTTGAGQVPANRAGVRVRLRRARHGTARPDSDIDVAVQAAQPLATAARMQWIEALALATGRPVDLIDLRTTGEPLLGQILKHGVRIIGNDAAHAELVLRHLYAMEDFVPYVRRMLEERKQSWIR